MSKYRTHTCGELTLNNKDQTIKLSGWINKKRDHGNLLFLDLRDHYGLTQCVIDEGKKIFKEIEKLPLETVLQVEGKVLAREKDTINKNLNTGEIEVGIEKFKIEYSEEIRLKYRFLDLRRNKIHNNIILRSKIISFIRTEMQKYGFLEYQTPILTSSSPEGARDFLVPSRLNPGKFYALPQAPQQFKQLIMVSGFDKYFQIADVFKIVEELFVNLFKKFSSKKLLHEKFPRIPFDTAMLKYGSDKPDLRNPLEITMLTLKYLKN